MGRRKSWAEEEAMTSPIAMRHLGRLPSSENTVYKRLGGYTMKNTQSDNILHIYYHHYLFNFSICIYHSNPPLVLTLRVLSSDFIAQSSTYLSIIIITLQSHFYFVRIHWLLQRRYQGALLARTACHQQDCLVSYWRRTTCQSCRAIGRT